MSLVAELSKLQERKDALLKEVALIDRELEQVAIVLGVKKANGLGPAPKSQVVHHSGLGDTKPRRQEQGATYRQIEHWLRMQPTAKTSREISEGALTARSTTHMTLSNHHRKFIKRGNRWGVSETQFADRTADLEEQSRGVESSPASASLIAPSMNGAMATSSALTTTANTDPDVSE